MKKLDFSALCAELEKLGGRSVSVFIHERADGDALGSAIGLCEIISALGGRARICSPDGIPERLDFLGCETGEPSDGDVFVSVDLPSREQFGRYAEYADKVSLKIDHHANGEEYADGYLDSKAAAAGEIIYEISQCLISKGLISELSTRFYEAVYAAISSDTGCFRFSNVTPDTHRCAGEIIGRGIDSAEINRQLFDSHTMGEVAAAKLAYSALNTYAGGRIAVVSFSSQMQSASGLGERDLGSIIDIPRGIKGVLVAAVIKQRTGDDGIYRVSLRANVDLDVSAIAARFGGGGHKRAAGASLEADSAESAEKIIVTAIEQAFTEQGIL